MAEAREAGLVCLGAVAGAHGVRGLVKVKPFTAEPEALLSYGPLFEEGGKRSFRLALRGKVKDQLLVAIDGVGTREQAEALKGLRLHVPRSALPPPEDPEEFYHADLIGLEAWTPEGTALGRVGGVQNFGAGDLLELVDEGGGVHLLPFTRSVVPEIDLALGRLTVVPPVETTVEPAEGDGPDQHGESEE